MVFKIFIAEVLISVDQSKKNKTKSTEKFKHMHKSMKNKNKFLELSHSG